MPLPEDLEEVVNWLTDPETSRALVIVEQGADLSMALLADDSPGKSMGQTALQAKIDMFELLERSREILEKEAA